MMIFNLIVLLAVAYCVTGLNFLPERARGGELYKQLVERVDKNLKSSTALTWNAPVDHFSNTTNTFAQRFVTTMNCIFLRFINCSDTMSTTSTGMGRDQSSTKLAVKVKY